MTDQCPICNGALQEGESCCPLCGYRVPGRTESFTPVQMGSRASVDEVAIEREYDLLIVRGPQTGIEIGLHEGEMTIGRDPRCDIFLNDMTVSRDHAVIEVKSTGCIIRDLNSVNGVWVNDRLVEVCSLRPDDQIQVGAFCLLYREKPVKKRGIGDIPAI